MDGVGTFNHLIPSDQLEESLLIGQNLESEASDEFGTGHHVLEDSLKNMLSDKDPMLGSASAQFLLLDNEDTGYEVADSAGLAGMSKSKGTCGVSRSPATRPKGQRGRPRKIPAALPSEPSHEVDPEPVKSGLNPTKSTEAVSKPASSRVTRRCDRREGVKQQQQEAAEAQEDPADASQDKEEGAGRSTVCSEVGQSMNPVVVLRRLTVTVGGYKIELLPGPSKSPSTSAPGATPSQGFSDASGGVEGVNLSAAQDVAVTMADGKVVEHLTSAQDIGKCSPAEAPAEAPAGAPTGAPAELGPCVNPNEVQECSGVLLSSSHQAVDVCTAETEANNPSDLQQPDSGSVKETKGINSGGSETRTCSDANKSVVLEMAAGKDGQDQKPPAQKQLKSKPSPASPKKKNLEPSTSKKAGAEPKTPQPKDMTKGDIQDMQTIKGKSVTGAKRRTEHLQTYPPSKMSRVQGKRLAKPDVGPKMSSPFHPVVKRLLPGTVSPDGSQKRHPGTQAGNSKSPHLPFGPKPAHPQVAVAKPSHFPREPSEDDDQERLRAKKQLEKASQRPRSKSARSLSVDEPPLFIPDNAPLLKKEAAEEEPAEGEGEVIWDPSKHCGFCRKPHSNRFMVGCGRCDDWFHGECVGLDLVKAQQMEKEDQEYVCLKCCAEEDKKVESEDHGAASVERQVKAEQAQENKPAVRYEKISHQPSAAAVRKDSLERRSQEDRDGESRASASDQKAHVPRRPHLSGDATHKMGTHDRQEAKKAKTSPAASKKPSVEQIRRNVRDSLKDILLKRLNESDLKVSTERAGNVANKTEKELFAFFRDTDSKYKSKYRSLMFNLKDAKNNVLFKRVLKGEISPHHLIRMSPEELASKELAAWRQRENRHTIEMIEKEQREVDRRPIIKITHKGEIEIENQEPEKEPEPADIEPEPVPRPPEEPEMAPPEPEPENTKDTTAQHKAHLFDLNCKICTGRMAPPVEDATTKVVKVATTVMRRQTSTEAEGQTSASSPAEDLPFSAMEDGLVSPRVLSSIDERLSGREDETTFLDRLELLWKGFVNMPSVAKFVTKAHPVSGVLDHLTEDLPDSIQVGGRISPQTVWDYVEKIRASGTKEVCLIRFSPVTEEDEISYTLLYAYFSSRRRYGVVANNMKHVKDMYLIPLGASEKIPHQLVPFDGPGLEANRPNVLLGLIIRQRVKRDFGVLLSVDIPEASSARFLPDSRTKLDSSSESGSALTGEDYLNSLKGARSTEATNPQQSAVSDTKTGKLQLVEAPLTTEGNLHETAKPLRFLPGVLVGREEQPCADAASRPLAAVDAPQGLSGSSEEALSRQPQLGGGTGGGNGSSRSPASNGLRLDRFIIKKKDSKGSNPEPQQRTAGLEDSLGKGLIGDPNTATPERPLKAEPPVDSEGVLPNLPSRVGQGLDKASKADYTGQEAKHEGLTSVSITTSNSVLAETSSTASKASPSGSAASPAQPPSGIPKAGSVADSAEKLGTKPSSAEGHTKQEAAEADGHLVSQERPLASGPDPSTQPVPHQPAKDTQTSSTILSFGKAEDCTPRLVVHPNPPAPVFCHVGQGLPVATFPPGPDAEVQYQQAPTPLFQAPDQQAQSGFTYSGAPLPFPQSNPSHQYPSTTWPSTPAVGFQHSQHVPSGPPLSFDASRTTESSKSLPAPKEDKAPEQYQGDPWDRQPWQADDGYKRESSDQHGQLRHHSETHHEKKGRHHDRDREHGKSWEHQSEKGGQWERSRSRSRSRERSSRERHRGHDDKHRDSRARHRSRSGSEHSRSERHHRQHGEWDKHHERDRDKHRRDSYDKGRRSSRDGAKDGRS
ncbi:PHD finger protein 3 isoform X3 [Brienomyrus brachyistius]|uniref:PHD finger protein 3 isoform X3 n=1 Tax=Brienomyrus brachyistius TaxID=42636 RepID=UPI0020B2B5FE|nr:PHD finger protein 3 isoform X3 [Brienomyrus brachyistius]XP_048862787.1 PHD finger protein 3 isoform X3 [Brienomyrus brachyistius]